MEGVATQLSITKVNTEKRLTQSLYVVGISRGDSATTDSNATENF